jgi:hypothetical protein
VENARQCGGAAAISAGRKLLAFAAEHEGGGQPGGGSSSAPAAIHVLRAARKDANIASRRPTVTSRAFRHHQPSAERNWKFHRPNRSVGDVVTHTPLCSAHSDENNLAKEKQASFSEGIVSGRGETTALSRRRAQKLKFHRCNTDANEQANERTDGRTEKRTNERTNEQQQPPPQPPQLGRRTAANRTGEKTRTRGNARGRVCNGGGNPPATSDCLVLLLHKIDVIWYIAHKLGPSLVSSSVLVLKQPRQQPRPRLSHAVEISNSSSRWHNWPDSRTSTRQPSKLTVSSSQQRYIKITTTECP